MTDFDQENFDSVNAALVPMRLFLEKIGFLANLNLAGVTAVAIRMRR